MSSSPNLNDQGDPTGKESLEESSVEGSAERVVETVECLNCGRTFVGKYCPQCGQEADPSTSVTGVIGGFFRDFVDIGHGFWPTFVALTVRPGELLQEYLRGVRKGLVNPGRYLLAALIIDIGADRLLGWIGVRTLPWTNPDVFPPPEVRSDDIYITALQDTLAVAIEPQTRFITVLLMAGLLAAVLYRLFAEIGQMSEALAVGSYLLGHATFLSRGADLLYVVPAFIYTGEAVTQPSFLLIFVLGYLVYAGYQAFGPGWKVAVKVLVAGGWAFALWVAVFGLSACVYAVGQAMWYPWGWEYMSTGAVLVSAIIFALPLLLHAGVETYYRLW